MVEPGLSPSVAPAGPTTLAARANRQKMEPDLDSTGKLLAAETRRFLVKQEIGACDAFARVGVFAEHGI